MHLTLCRFHWQCRSGKPESKMVDSLNNRESQPLSLNVFLVVLTSIPREFLSLGISSLELACHLLAQIRECWLTPKFPFRNSRPDVKLSIPIVDESRLIFLQHQKEETSEAVFWHGTPYHSVISTVVSWKFSLPNTGFCFRPVCCIFRSFWYPHCRFTVYSPLQESHWSKEVSWLTTPSSTPDGAFTL
jgi:hypothetical protein